eukprot:3227587-Amphidinium_carterae.1
MGAPKRGKAESALSKQTLRRQVREAQNPELKACLRRDGSDFGRLCSKSLRQPGDASLELEVLPQSTPPER